MRPVVSPVNPIARPLRHLPKLHGIAAVLFAHPLHGHAEHSGNNGRGRATHSREWILAFHVHTLPYPTPTSQQKLRLQSAPPSLSVLPVDVATAEKTLTAPDSKPLSVDTGKRRPFQPLPVNWLAIKEEYCKGELSAKQLADKHGIKVDAIWQRSHREVWPSPVKTIKRKTERMAKVAVQQKVASVMKRVEPALERAVKEWQARTIAHAGKAVERAGAYLSQELEPEELKTVVSVLDTADRVGRRSLGLDKEQSGSSPVGAVLHMRLELLGLAGSPLPTGPTVDIQALTESAQERAEGPANPV